MTQPGGSEAETAGASTLRVFYRDQRVSPYLTVGLGRLRPFSWACTTPTIS